jgi:predicted nucleic acid-binding protein
MFLDSSAIIEDLRGNEAVAELVSRADLTVTSSICVTEVLSAPMGAGSTDVDRERSRFGGVRSIPFDERLARRAGALQDDLFDRGEPLPGRDLMIAATAIDVDDTLVVTDADFDTDPITDRIDVVRIDPLPF